MGTSSRSAVASGFLANRSTSGGGGFVAARRFGLCDRAPAPPGSPRATPLEVIIRSCVFGSTITWCRSDRRVLMRFHRVTDRGSTVTAHHLTPGTGCLGSRRIEAPAARASVAALEKPQPGHRLQVDVEPGAHPGTQKRCLCSPPSMMRPETGLEGLRRLYAGTAIQFIKEVLRRLPFRVHVIQTDDGAEFNHSFTGTSSPCDIRQRTSASRTPHLEPQVDAPVASMAMEFSNFSIATAPAALFRACFNEKLREWENSFRFHEPHGALGGLRRPVATDCDPEQTTVRRVPCNPAARRGRVTPPVASASRQPARQAFFLSLSAGSRSRAFEIQ